MGQPMICSNPICSLAPPVMKDLRDKLGGEEETHCSSPTTMCSLMLSQTCSLALGKSLCPTLISLAVHRTKGGMTLTVPQTFTLGQA